MEMINFDERARDWDSDPAKVERARVVAQAILAAVPLKPDMTALEYGCGTGLLSFALHEGFKSILLVDTSQGMLDVLSEKIKTNGLTNMLPLRVDLSTEQLPTSRFNIIYSLMALHHTPDVAIVLQKFFTVLAAPGYLCIADLDSEDGSFHGGHVSGVHHGFDRSALQHQVESVGFHDVKFTTVHKIKKQGDKTEKEYPLFLMVAKKTV